MSNTEGKGVRTLEVGKAYRLWHSGDYLIVLTDYKYVKSFMGAQLTNSAPLPDFPMQCMVIKDYDGNLVNQHKATLCYYRRKSVHNGSYGEIELGDVPTITPIKVAKIKREFGW
jgi:hypothetical protein